MEHGISAAGAINGIRELKEKEKEPKKLQDIFSRGRVRRREEIFGNSLIIPFTICCCFMATVHVMLN